MDPFDDVLPVAPAARARPGAKFIPKAKLKQLPRKEIPATSSKDGVSENQCQNAVASSMGYIHHEQVQMGNPEQVSVKGDSAPLVDNSTLTASQGDAAAQNSSNFLKSACKVASAGFELEPFSNILPDSGTRNAHKFQPRIKPRPRVGNMPAVASASSNVMMEKSVELPTSCTNDFQSFQSNDDGIGGPNQSISLPSPTSEILRTTDLPHKFDDMNSRILISENKESLAEAIPSQLDSLNDMLSEDAVHNGTGDWPSSFSKSSGEAADIFSGLESLDDFLTQAATDTGKPALHSFNEKGAEESYHTAKDSLTFNETAILNEDDSHTNNRRSETEEVMNTNPPCPGDDAFDHQSMKSGEDPTSGIPVHEELTNAADSPTLADILHTDVTREKEDDSMPYSLRKKRKSSIAGEEDKGGKTSRQLRKQAARKPANSSLNEDVEDNNDLDPPYNSNGDEIQENDDDYEVDNSSKKKRTSTSSQKKSEGKSEKTSRKRKKDNDDLEKSKEPPKKFSHSTRRRKRCVDKALLEIPEDELELGTLPMKDIILIAEHRERLKKKDATTSNTSFNHQSGGDSLHEASDYYKESAYYEKDAYHEEEYAGLDDGRNPDDDQANEEAPTPSLFNYQSFMEKAPRGKWSKQDTELFYEAVRELGTDFSMIKQLFPGKTRHQIKLKYKKEERQHPLRLTDAVNNRAKDHSHYKLLIERLQLVSTKAEKDPGRDASDFMTVEEEVVDPTPETNNEEAAEVATTKQEADVKAPEDDEPVHSPEQSDESDDDFQKWSQYQSAY